MQTRLSRGGGARGGWLDGAQGRQRKLCVRLGIVSLAMALAFLAPSSWDAGRVEAQTSDSGDRDSRGREILLGTMETRAPRAPRDLDRGEAATRLLDEAMVALDGGEVMLGRRGLEALVQSYPETLAAGAARQQLSRLADDRRAMSGRYSQSPDSRWRPPGRPEPAGDGERLGYNSSRDLQYRDPAPVDAMPAQTQVPSNEVEGRRQRLQDERRLQALARDFQATAGDRVFFGETNDDLGSRARAVLVAQARWLAAHPELPITIAAHADDAGTAVFNTAIAERRGHAVRDRLIAEGVAADRITVRAYGRDRPVATCQASECAAQNRRVVTQIGDQFPDGAEDRSGAGRGPAVAAVPGQARR